jgi:hypothetical protein
VVYLSAPSSYQLRLRNGDRYHHRFWGQLLRWAIARDLAAGSKTVKLSTDKSNYGPRDEIQVSLQLVDVDGTPVSDARPSIAAYKSDTPVTTVELERDEQVPGRYVGRIEPLPAGNYRLEAAGPDVNRLLASEQFDEPVSRTVSIGGKLPDEMVDTRANRPLLEHARPAVGPLAVPVDHRRLSDNRMGNPQTHRTLVTSF